MALVLLLAAAAGGRAFAADRWVTHPAAVAADVRHDPVALQFRRDVTLDAAPAHLFVHVSADNRFVLFVNGRRVAEGPARGDLLHWRYERLDLAPHLRRGRNVIAAEVWNDGRDAPRAQVSARTGFLLSAEDAAQGFVDSGPGWRVRVDGSRTVAGGMAQLISQVGGTYYVAGPPETHDGAARAADWAAARTSATDWVAAVDAVRPGETAPWALMRNPLPQMSYTPAVGDRLVRAQGVPRVAGFPHAPVAIPAHSEATLLLDAGEVQTAYPRLTVSGGRGAVVTVTYAETLYGADRQHLSDRAQVEGGRALGLTDTFRPGGRAHDAFQPFWWREWRYAEIRVKTAGQPLRLEGFQRFTTGYPFQVRGRFASSDPELDRIWRIGWRTLQVDAHETFMDTAYWEQMQYAGDGRIEALVADAVSGDPRLPEQAIAAFDGSRVVDGLPQAAWPSRLDQSIPPFALLWIGMIHDHWMHYPDTRAVRAALPGARSVLDWYAKYVGPDGLVGTTPGWGFIDWRPGLSEEPGEKSSTAANTCIVTLMYVGALQQSAELEQALGEGSRAAADAAEAARASAAVQARCWSAQRGLYANGPDKTAFSQHANVLAVLYDVAPKAQQPAILDRITVRNGGIDPPAGITGTTFYFSFYLARALDHAGVADRYPELLATWRKLLAHNFTTWPETPDPSRSDSHAWSAHPTADLLALVAGVQPSSPGFASVRIAPHLGALTRLDAALAHPAGLIEVSYRRRGDHLAATVKLPGGLAGEFQWGGRSAPLRPGTNVLALTAGAANKVR